MPIIIRETNIKANLVEESKSTSDTSGQAPKIQSPAPLNPEEINWHLMKIRKKRAER